MVIPSTLSNYFDRRPGLAIPNTSSIQLSGTVSTNLYRLHPAMPRIASLWSEGKVAAVQRVGYPQANLSHFTSQDIFSYGVRNSFGELGIPISGWVARFADREAPTPMGAVGLGVGRPLDFEGGQTSPFTAYNLPNFQLNLNRNSPSEVHRLQAAKDLLADFSGTGNQQAAKEAQSLAYDLADQIQTALADYNANPPPVTWGTDYFSQRMREISVLIRGGFETRLFYTGFGGFDTHSGQGQETGAQANLFGYLDAGVGALAEDLKQAGLWNDTMIVVITEFGRRNYENGSAGTDHGHAFCELVLGGPVRGGIYGPDLTNADLATEYPSYAVDFRSIYMEALANHMGADAGAIFPEPLEQTVNLGIV
jgi:uncharacterized protein (DUF1501 family)